MDARRPQRCGRTPPSVGAPVLAVQSLRGFDGVDNTAAKFLLQQALKKKEEEEEERRKREKEEKRLAAHDEATAALPTLRTCTTAGTDATTEYPTIRSCRHRGLASLCGPHGCKANGMPHSRDPQKFGA